MSKQKELIYFGDPMCSWCYGFAPELKALRDHYTEEVDFKMVMGGLRPYEQEAMDQKMKGFLREHWDHVFEASGQPFSYDLLEPDTSFVYNTEPACRAVVTMLHLKPEVALEFYDAIQKVFYAENKDTNELQTFVDLLPEFGVDAAAFKAFYEGEQGQNATKHNFQTAAQFGIRGFPSVVLRIDEQYYMVSNGYAKKEALIGNVERALEKHTAEA